MTNIGIRILTAALFASACSSAFAGKDGGRMMERLDTDGDNLISQEEFQPPGGRSARMMDGVDADGDGAITLDEMQQASEAKMAKKQAEVAARMDERAEHMKKSFAEMDADGSGSVTAEEMRLHMFNKMDENQDGYLSAEEFSHARHNMHKRSNYGQDDHQRWEHKRGEHDHGEMD